MKCYYCGNELGKGDICSYCGANMHYYKKIIASSNLLYNRGLAKAKERDLTGAVESLRRCLRLNKANIDARNLLGLVYYEMGDYPGAISEWAISRTLLTQDNPATPYLYELIGGEKRAAVNELVEKYNQAVVYQQQGSVDLAILQLKKVLAEQPGFLKARQLLGLLYASQGEYNEAKSQLRSAEAIDRKNPRTQWYLKEIGKISKAMGVSNRHHHKEDSVSYQNGNDTVIQPVQKRFASPRAAVYNFVIGMLIGALVVYFLVVPSVRASINSNANKSVTSANEQLAQQKATVDSLKSQIETLNSKVASYESADAESATTTSNYEYMLKAYQDIQDSDLTSAQSALDKVDESILSSDMDTIYQGLVSQAYGDELKSYYQTASSSYQSKSYATAIENYKKIIELDESYNDGAALYYLAASYYQYGDNDNAVTYYKKVMKLFPDSEYATESQKMISTIESSSKSTSSSSTTGTSTDSSSSTTGTGANSSSSTTGTGTNSSGSTTGTSTNSSSSTRGTSTTSTSTTLQND